jgi:hypothetical protein
MLMSLMANHTSTTRATRYLIEIRKKGLRRVSTASCISHPAGYVGQSSGAVSSRVVLRFADSARVIGARGGFVPSAKSPSNGGIGSPMRLVEMRELESRVTPGITFTVELSQK